MGANVACESIVEPCPAHLIFPEELPGIDFEVPAGNYRINARWSVEAGNYVSFAGDDVTLPVDWPLLVGADNDNMTAAAVFPARAIKGNVGFSLRRRYICMACRRDYTTPVVQDTTTTADLVSVTTTTFSTLPSSSTSTLSLIHI